MAVRTLHLVPDHARHFTSVILLLPVLFLSSGPVCAEPGPEPQPPARTTTDPNWIDWSHDELSDRIVDTARWFDSFFGDRRFEEEVRGTRIRLRPEVTWSESGTLRSRLGFSLRLALPNLDNRVQIVADNVFRENDFPGGPDDRIDSGFAPTGDDVDIAAAARILLGDRNDLLLDLDVGLEFHSYDVEPFIKVRTRKLFDSDTIALRLTQFVYWRMEDGFGATSRFDIDTFAFGQRFFRSATEATWSEVSNGVEFEQRVSLYRRLDEGRRAVGAAVTAFVHTDPGEFPLFTAELKYRQQFLRDWLFFEILPQAAFPRERDYNFTPRLTMRFDIIYGDHMNR